MGASWLASPEEIESGSTREPGQGRNPKEVGKERKHLTESVCSVGPRVLESIDAARLHKQRILASGYGRGIDLIFRPSLLRTVYERIYEDRERIAAGTRCNDPEDRKSRYCLRSRCIIRYLLELADRELD